MPIEIESLSISEKLALVDRIWSSLHADPDSVPSPSWHEPLLKERLRRLESGEATTSPLSEVKERMENLGD
ncbi:MAG: addiction module protein [Planctomycetota bacterium]